MMDHVALHEFASHRKDRLEFYLCDAAHTESIILQPKMGGEKALSLLCDAMTRDIVNQWLLGELLSRLTSDYCHVTS